MNYWIFQGNLDTFDISKYISEHDKMQYDIRQRGLSKEMRKDDEVYIWLAAGKRKQIPGVIAVARIVDGPRDMPDDEDAASYYNKPDKPDVSDITLRVTLRFEHKCLGQEEIVKKEMCKEDPVLQYLSILRVARFTNYKITQQQAQRLAFLCRKKETQQREISKSIAPPVAHKVSYTDFGEAPNDDPNELAQFAARVRRGQPKLRNTLIQLYGSKCAITGWGPNCVLEAAHIDRHSKSGINHSSNGLLLRADIHSLFDIGFFRINPENLTVLVHPSLENTPYWNMNGTILRPRINGTQPERKYLRKRWDEKGDD